MGAQKVATKGVLAVGNVGVKAHDKVMTAIENKKRRDAAATAAMNKKYPGGWSQSATNMTEWSDIRRNIK